jgi:predicted transcriptional regulator
MEKNTLLELEKRRQIYDYILKHPGIHISDLSKKLDLPRSTLVYHLRYLKKLGFIDETRCKKYTRYYVSKEIDRTHKKILNLFREEATRRIGLYLAQNQLSSVNEISKNMNKDRSTISYHLKKLNDAGILKHYKINGEKKYCLYEGNGLLLWITFTNEDIFDEETKRVIKKLRRKMDKHGVDKILEIVLEILPHPYHV